MSKWISVKDRLPSKNDGWIGYTQRMYENIDYYIRVLAYEAGGYGGRIVIRQFHVAMTGTWTMENDKCEIVFGSFLDDDAADWIVTHWMPLPPAPRKNG